MRPLIITLFTFSSFYCFAQKEKKKIKENYILMLDSSIFSFRDSTIHFPILTPDNLNLIYKSDTNSLEITATVATKIFSCSFTVWDETKIILFDSSRFFAYHVECTERFCTSGYYKQNGSVYTLSSDRTVLDSLKKNIDEYYAALDFVEFKQKVFKESNGLFSFVQ
jgi:hypothetical protein